MSKKGKVGLREPWMATDPRAIFIDYDDLCARYGKYFIQFVAGQDMDYIIQWFAEDEGLDISKAVGIAGIRKILSGRVD